MIIVSLTSGLGNQLFQFFFGETLRLKYHNQIIKYLNASLVEEQLNIWDIFKLNYEFIDINEIKKNRFIFRNKYFFINYIKLLIKLNLIPKYIYSDVNYDYTNDFLLDDNKDNLFYGYWQNTNFFKNNFNLIKKKLKFKENLSLYEFDKTLKSYSDLVGVHIRGGDYKKNKNKKIFSKIDNNYYFKNINYFLDKLDNPCFLFFTDDQTYLENLIPNMNFSYRMISKLNTNPKNDFQLLSLCDHFIIPNSTFSLWAANFSLNKRKIIKLPSQWFKESYLSKNNFNFNFKI